MQLYCLLPIRECALPCNIEVSMNGYLTICANDSSEEFNLIGYAEIDGGNFKGTL